MRKFTPPTADVNNRPSLVRAEQLAQPQQQLEADGDQVKPSTEYSENSDVVFETPAQRIERFKRQHQEQLAQTEASPIKTVVERAAQSPSPIEPTAAISVEKKRVPEGNSPKSGEKLRQTEHKRPPSHQRRVARQLSAEAQGRGLGSFLLVNRFSITGLVFLLVIFTGMFIHLLHPKQLFSEQERRNLQTWPEISRSSIFSGQFMQDFEKFANDQMPYRDFLLGINRLLLTLQQRSDNGRVIFCNDDYLVKLTSNNMKQVEKNIRYLNSLNLTSNEDDPQNFYLMLIPNASSVIRSELPAGSPTLDQIEFINDTYNKLSNFKTVNCYDNLLALGKKAYYRTDHHWNSLGAYNGALSYLQTMGSDLPAESEYQKTVIKDDFLGSLYAQTGGFNQTPDCIEVWQHQDNNLNNKVRCYDQKNKLIGNGIYRRDELFSFDPYRVFLGENQGFMMIDTGIENGKNLLLIKDSYSNSMVPFLTYKYQRIYIVDLRFLDKSLKQMLHEYKVQDILIAYNVDSFLTDNNIYKLVD